MSKCLSFLLVIVTFAIGGCSKTSNDFTNPSNTTPPVINNPSSPSTPGLTGNIYVAGFESNGSHYVAKYWKDGIPVILSDGTKDAVITQLLFSGTDVYAAGWETLAQEAAVYWKNGIRTVLTNGINSASSNDIAVVGSDVYVRGVERNGGLYYTAKYWKNCNPVTLGPSTHISNTSGIYISGSDVFVGGYEQLNNIGPDVYSASLWKNGALVPLNNTSSSTILAKVFVKGVDTYFAGMSGSFSVSKTEYWKNGTEYLIPSSYYSSDATDIFVTDNNDVYVCGEVIPSAGGVGQATYWKNGIAVTLSNTGTHSWATCIRVIGSDVYVSGVETTSAGIRRAKYWKNGVGINLTDGTQNAAAYTLRIVP